MDELSSVRATRRAIAALSNPLPLFVHKWSGELRHYLRAELDLPDQVTVEGSSVDFGRPMIAFGGTRSPAVETFCLSTALAEKLAGLGCLIVSGGVPGVDLAAHLGALALDGGGTIAVMANPPSLGLAGHEWSSPLVDRAIRRTGVFMSEYESICSLNSSEHKERLLMRDRIISGICDVFVLFECTDFSASIDTAQRALIQGKRVIVVTSDINSNRRGQWHFINQNVEVIKFEFKDGNVLEIASEIKKHAIDVRALST